MGIQLPHFKNSISLLKLVKVKQLNKLFHVILKNQNLNQVPGGVPL